MRRRITWITGGTLLLAFAIFCCLYFIPKTTSFDMTLDTVKYDYDGNEYGTVPIHVQGALKEYLFRTSTLALHIDDFDFVYDIRPWTNHDGKGNYEDFKVNWDSNGFETGIVFYGNSTVTGENSVWVNFCLREDLKQWEFHISPSLYADEAVRNDPTFDLAYLARLE